MKEQVRRGSALLHYDGVLEVLIADRVFAGDPSYSDEPPSKSGLLLRELAQVPHMLPLNMHLWEGCTGSDQGGRGHPSTS